LKVAVLAGGLGSRLCEETTDRPKALVEIGGRPILWHILQHYCHYGLREFVIALGHRGNDIIDYMTRSLPDHLRRDVSPATCLLPDPALSDRPWTVELIDTGESTSNGGRVKRLAPYLGERTFMLTWCDGLSDVNLHQLLGFHRRHGRLATVTAVHPPSRFGLLELRGDVVTAFSEKPTLEDQWVNGAFFVLEPAVIEYIGGDATSFEKETLVRLAGDRQIVAYRHTSFWQCMDTIRDRQYLDSLYQSGRAPWKTWE
jgi:glucose-1-phosphate cytidylyltransferase